MKGTIEKKGFIEKYTYIVVAYPIGHRCGYVRIARDNPLFNEFLGNNNFLEVYELCVHGGITFVETSVWWENKEGSLWIGFDCTHYGDAQDPQIRTYYAGERQKEGEIRTCEYVENECLSLIKQLKTLEPDRWKLLETGGKNKAPRKLIDLFRSFL